MYRKEATRVSSSKCTQVTRKEINKEHQLLIGSSKDSCSSEFPLEAALLSLPLEQEIFKQLLHRSTVLVNRKVSNL
jgi:hypothetical protein